MFQQNRGLGVLAALSLPSTTSYSQEEISKNIPLNPKEELRREVFIVNNKELSVMIPNSWKRVESDKSKIIFKKNNGFQNIIITAGKVPDLKDLLDNPPKSELEYDYNFTLASLGAHHLDILELDRKEVNIPVKPKDGNTSTGSAESFKAIKGELILRTSEEELQVRPIFPKITPPQTLISKEEFFKNFFPKRISPKRTPMVGNHVGDGTRVYSVLEITESKGTAFVIWGYVDITGINDLDRKGKPNLELKLIKRGFRKEIEPILVSFFENDFAGLDGKGE